MDSFPWPLSRDVVAIVPEAVYRAARINAEQAVQKAQKMEAIGNLTGALHTTTSIICSSQRRAL